MKRVLAIVVISAILGALAITPALAESHIPDTDTCNHDATIASVEQCVEHMLQSGNIDSVGVANNLMAMLSAAQAAQDRGQTETAIAILSALANQVEAQSGKHIAEPQANHLVQHIQQVIDQLAS